ncbi:Xaa-Pro dipeptidase Metallo peptidase. MEROPS family M24B [Dyella jiangningensis]|uniref:Xaa-Pro dipeptidase n=1 Tax=Dyella sp. AtDHG13 TaxID=1938897 RepID=UPI000887E8FD|nr:Xaa-Pro dipeptidase [Dyella sp. AtDHG13]PXV59609.1 Xaa-Pro dipeptidase [Dyella sp. AtDHG13]SDJ30171.1 Xaa-Pro dipeptidase Metallo peptidase. MEROPS family M24B [Dyella jiangningensis]
MQDRLAPLYPQHLATLRERADKALALGGFDHLVIAAGTPLRKFLDDQDYPFVANPHFRHWLPLTDTPGSWIVHTPGRKPKLIYLQPKDYWHVVPAAPTGYWVEHFDIEIVRSATDAVALLPGESTRRAIIGPECPAVPGAEANNPQAVMDYLHWHRSIKTPYELELMREASRIGARAHRAAEQAFRAGESEFGIHMAYLAAARQVDAELPYASIVALNEHGAVLHYTHFDRKAPSESRSFLIDAGASAAGYASDITRTYAARGHEEFQALIDSVDVAQRGFAAKVRVGQSYPELHIHAHHVLAEVLREHGIVRMSAESAVASGVTSAFFPHGLGHPIGLQVHDVAGFQASETGGTIARPPGHPYLRMTRVLEPGMVVTIEPGLYFIDMLLDELRDKPVAADIDWTRVERLRPYGGIRIEDDVVCTTDAPENLTRDAFASL